MRSGSGKLFRVKRLLWLVPAAGVAVWGGALIDFGHKDATPPAPEARAEQGAPPAAPPERAARLPAAAPAAAVRAGRMLGSRAAVSSVRTGGGPGVAAPRPGQGSVAVIGAAEQGRRGPARVAAAASAAAAEPDAPQAADTRELGQGVGSPQLAALEHDYVEEARDGPWALAEEQRVRALLRGQPLAPDVVLVHCQQSVCRMVLQTDSADAFQQLLQVPGLSAETALDGSSPFSLHGGQLAVYFHPAKH